MEESSTVRESDVDTTSDAAKPSRGSVRGAAVVTALCTAAAATLAFSPPASAHADFSVWDRVASCESSNRWHINTGNGYYGGVQFSSSTWAGYGGHKYAGQADHATRLEQIEVARRVLAAQGANAWPVCGPRAGLTKSTGHATHRPLPAKAGSEHTHAARHHHHHGAHRHAGRNHNRHHQARHHHHAGTHHHAARHGHYTVRSGDTLSKIASRLHVDGGWRALYHANRSKLSNPNVIHIGQVLRLP